MNAAAISTTNPGNDAEAQKTLLPGFSFTLFRKDKGILTKRMKLENGQLVKDASECRMSRGRAETVTLAPEQFGAFLQGLKPNQAIAHGICGHRKAQIVSKAKENGARPANDGLPIIARTKEHFHYPEGPGVMMLDHDKARANSVALDDKALQAYSPDRLVEIISSFFPKIIEAAYVSACSTSSCIYSTETGEELRGKGAGFHLYLFPNNAADGPRFLSVLGKRLVLAGYGRVEISRAGALLERTLADLLVGSPERLDFVAGAICDKGLEQRRPEPEYHQGSLLDTANLPDLTAEEESRYQEIIRQLKEKAQPTQETIKVEICSSCHPFFTGRQKLVDTAGRIDRFRRKYAHLEKQGGKGGEKQAAGEAGGEAAAATETPAES